MPNRDLTAPSSQAKSERSAAAHRVGAELYASIVDDGNADALLKFQGLAEASEETETPVESEPSRQPGHAKRGLMAVGTLFTR
jgi:hypothetical protein